MAGGVITLAEVRAKGMTMLEVACRRCERRGRLRIERFIAEHGSGVLDLRASIAFEPLIWRKMPSDDPSVEVGLDGVDASRTVASML